MSKTDDVLLVEKEEVVVGDETFEVGPLVRAKYGSLIKVFAELLLNMDQEILENAEEHLDTMIAVISDEALVKLYSTVLDKSEKWVNNNMTMSQEMNLFRVIVETNEVEKLAKNFTQVYRMMKTMRGKKKTE